MERFYKAQAENWKTLCDAKPDLCVIAKPQFTMGVSTEAGAVSILKAELNGSASLPTGTAVNLSAVPQKSAVAVPLSLQSGGFALLPTTGTWLLKLSIGTEECPGLPQLTVTCLPTFVPTPSGGCACPPGQDNEGGKCVVKTTTSLCSKASPQLSLSPSNATGATSTLQVAVTSSGLPAGTAIALVAVPQNAAKTLTQPGSLELPSPGTWLLQLTVGGEPCTGLPPQNVTCLVDRGFVESDGRCACPIGQDNVGGYCKRTESLCVQAKPHFTMAKSTEAGAVSILKAEFNGSASLPNSTAVKLTAVPQREAVAVPLSLQSGGLALLPTTGTWLLKLSIGNESCTGLLEPTVTCLPTFVATPSGGCACPPRPAE